MAIAVSNLTAALSTTNGGATASVAVPNNGVVYLCVAAAYSALGNGTQVSVGGTLNVGGWTALLGVNGQAYGSRRNLFVLRGVNTSGSEQSGTVTFTFSNTGAATYQEHIYHVDLITDADTTTPNGTVTSNAAAGATSGSVTVTGTPDAGDYVYLAFAHTGASSDMTINGELSDEIVETGGGGNVRRLLTAYDSTPDASPVPGVSWTGAEDWAGVAFIVNVGAGGPAYTPRSMLLGVG
jgi:hypothetical protein